MDAVDLNADLGESFGVWTLGDDTALLDLVSSASVACGFHAGDPLRMRSVCREAAAREVSIGAHVSYPDLVGFGRRVMEVEADALLADCVYQASALRGVAAGVGASTRYLKPHGALYNRIVHDPIQAGAVAAAAAELGLPLVGLPESAIATAADDAGVPFLHEAFVDRAYLPDGSLVPRGRPEAVLHDADAVALRAVRMVAEGWVSAIDGTRLPVQVDSLCVHGDTPGALRMAEAVRIALDREGVEVRSFA